MIASFRSSAFINYWRIGYYFLVSTEPRNDVLTGKGTDMYHHLSKNYQFSGITNTSKGIYNLNGMRMSATSLDDLPSGIYIINGKKVAK